MLSDVMGKLDERRSKRASSEEDRLIGQRRASDALLRSSTACCAVQGLTIVGGAEKPAASAQIEAVHQSTTRLESKADDVHRVLQV